MQAWPVPVEELVIVGAQHGRAGCAQRLPLRRRLEGHDWLRHLRKIVFLGTPHHGAPLERGGNWVDVILGASPYTAAFARLGKIRSAGITDLRYGSLLDEDWATSRPLRAFARQAPRRAAAGGRALLRHRRVHREERRRVPASGCSATDSCPLRERARPAREPGLNLAIPQARQWIGYGMNHLDLLDRQEVYAQLRQWLSAAS